MKRTHCLLIAVLLLLGGNIAWYIWNHWGLITINADKRPLGEIVRTIEKQGHTTLKTNLDAATPVTMHVKNVRLAEALETLATVTESRWRLAYYVAADKAAIGAALATFSAGQKPEGWKSVHVPLFGMSDQIPIPLDPRDDPWNVKPAKEATVQSYLEEASRSVSASFSYPESWNPAIAKPPKAGPIGKALPRLADAAHGKYEEVFLLMKSFRPVAEDDRPPRDGGEAPSLPAFGGNGGRGEGEGGRRPGGGRGGADRTAMEERMKAELEKLPAAQRLALQKEMEDRKAFFDSLRDLPADQRAAKMQDYMSQEDVQNRMEKAQASQDARRTPEQRIQRAQAYVQRRLAAQAGTN
jgi:hypothetical protein